jgi:beta-galactosidase
MKLPKNQVKKWRRFMDKKIYLGACYYPEQWPEERIEIDTDLMVEAGINVVRLADLCWSTMEPADGDFDFSLFDKVLAALHRKGIQAVMCTPTMVPPIWMWKKHPDIFGKFENAKSTDIRSRYCNNNPKYIEYTKRFVTKMAEHFKNNPAVIAWQIDNEFNAKPCVCDNCKREFREWLKEKYQNLEKLNNQWGTTFWSMIYTDWEQVAPPSSTELTTTVSQCVDFMRFTSDSVVKYAKLQADILRSICPNHLLTHNGMGVFPWLDYFKLGEILDFYSWDTYPAVDTKGVSICIAEDLSRGIKRKNFWVMEQKNGYFNYAPYNLAIEPGVVRLWSYRDIARGGDAVVYFRWRSGRYGSEQHPQGLLRHDGSKRRAYAEVKMLSDEMKIIGKDLCGSEVKADVAMLWSYDQIWAFETHVQNSNFSYLKHFSEYYEALFNLGVTTDIISSTADLSLYKIVVAPSIFMVNEAIAENLINYVSEGGTLILTARTGVRTWSNTTVDTSWPGLLRNITGASVIEFDSLPEHLCNEIRYKDKIYKVRTFLEILECDSAEVLGEYQNKFYKNQPGITVNNYGAGKTVYCGVMGNLELLEALFTDELAQLGLAVFKWPKGIEVTRRKSEDNTFTFVLNSNFEDCKVNLDKEYINAFTGEKLSGEINIKKLDVLVLK